MLSKSFFECLEVKFNNRTRKWSSYKPCNNLRIIIQYHHLFRYICRCDQTTFKQFHYHTLLSGNSCHPTMNAFKLTFCYNTWSPNLNWILLEVTGIICGFLMDVSLMKLFMASSRIISGGLRVGVSWRQMV